MRRPTRPPEATIPTLLLPNDGEPVAALVAALGERFAADEGAGDTVERTLLDTFDWRLHDAGLRLVLAGGVLELCGADGVVRARTRRTPPFRRDDLPEPIGERLGSLIDVRALLAVATVAVDAVPVDVRNADDKIVVRARVERRRVAGESGGDLPTRVVLRPVRGYDDELAEVAGALAAEPAPDELDEVAALAGRRPGDYEPRPDLPLEPWERADEAVARLLAHLRDIVVENEDGVRADLDPEFLHDFRVAVRRTRSALKTLGDVLPSAPVAELAEDLRWLQGVTGEPRDLDVQLLELPDRIAEVPDDLSGALGPLRDRLVARRRKARRQLLRALAGDRYVVLHHRWARLVDPATWTERTASGGRSIDEVAAERIRAQHRRVVKRGRRIDDASPDDDLHDLRKRGKELRYLLEMFAGLHEPAAVTAAVKELKKLQDNLGEFNDSTVQAEALRADAVALAEAGADAEALLAVGALVGRVAERHAAARAEFHDRFARFDSKKSRRRLAALTTTGSAR